MRVGRTILALLIALSVAILPAAYGVTTNFQSPVQADMSMMEDMHDCCPPKSDPCEKADCGMMAACALTCLSFTATLSSVIVFPSTFARMRAGFSGNSFSSQAGSPPFRPPRA